MCCDSWGHKESDTTERLNRTELRHCAHIGFFGLFSVFKELEFLASKTPK